MKNNSIWGYGLNSKRYFGGVLSMRQNTYVYDIEIRIKRVLIGITLWKKKP